MRRTALDAYIAHKAEIDTMLTRLKALSDEHFNVAPDAVTWGDVGTPSADRRGRAAGV